MTPTHKYPVIVAGASWHWEFYGTDLATGGDFDWIAAGLQVDAHIRDRNGTLAADLSTEAGAAGTVTLRSDGVIELDLPADVTTDLPITRDWAAATTDQLTSGWRDLGGLPFDLLVTDGAESWVLVDGFVTVQKLVTQF